MATTSSQLTVEPSDHPLYIKSKNELIKKFVRFINAAELNAERQDPVELLAAFCDSQKGKGKKSNPSLSQGSEESSAYHSAVDTDFELGPAPPKPGPDPAPATYKESYVTSFELEIDSQNVDQLNIIANSDEAAEAYLRLLGMPLCSMLLRQTPCSL